MRILIVGDGPVPHSYMNYRADVLLKYLMMKSSHSVVVICPRPERSGETSPSSENTSMGIRCHFEYLGPFVGVTGVTSAARRATDLISMTWRIRRVLKRTSMDCIRTIGVVPTISAVIA